jgi:IclR family acetate operon transcriptional repressor
MRLRTLDRGLELLEWVASHPGDASVRRAADELGLNTTTCYHLVDTLIARGYLVRQARGRLGVGTALSGLSSSFTQQARPMVLLASLATGLRDLTRESVFLSMWDGEEPVLVFFEEGPQYLRVGGFEPGFRGFAWCRTSGKAILAFLGRAALDGYLAARELTPLTVHSITDEKRLRAELDEVRQRGWAAEEEEFALGTCSVGAPFFGADGAVLGAVAAGLPPSRYEQSRDPCVEAVVKSGEQASRVLGYVGPYPPSPPR